jgi:uridine kinase
MPAPASAARAALTGDVAARVAGLASGRLRVAIDGLTCAGKTSFGHELAAALRDLGRPTIRASMDDFKNPWREARELGYDRLSGEGYYRNAYDFRSSGDLVLCGHDPLTGEDQRDTTITAPADAVLIVDSVFAFRPEYNDFWDYRIWLQVDTELALRRGVARDAAREGAQEALRVHRDRYHAAEMIYLTEVGPKALADLIIDNSDFARPVLLGGRDSGRVGREEPG